MALFTTPPFYQSQNTPPPATSIFQQTQNINLPTENNRNLYNPMKRRKGSDDSEPSAKRKHYEDRMSQRFDSLDLSNENPQPSIDIDIDGEFGIYEIDPEILDDSPQSLNDDFEQPIVEEPDDDEDKKIVISDELQTFMKKANNNDLLSKFQKKSGHELVVWQPPPIISIPSSSDSSSTAMNDRITEIINDEDIDIEDIADGLGQSHVTFPEENYSNRSSTSPPQRFNNSDQPEMFSSMSSSSSTSSIDGNHTIRMPTPTFSQTGQDYEPMEMD